jgi:hypothetical protein
MPIDYALNTRSGFSIGEALFKPKDIVSEAKRLGYKGAALVETMSVSSMMEFTSKASRTGKGLNTEYSVMPSAKSNPVDASVMAKLHNLNEYVKQEYDQGKLKALAALSTVSGNPALIGAGAVAFGGPGTKAIAAPTAGKASTPPKPLSNPSPPTPLSRRRWWRSRRAPLLLPSPSPPTPSSISSPPSTLASWRPGRTTMRGWHGNGTTSAHFTQAAFVHVLDVHKLSVDAYGKLAIYAAQKYRRILSALITEQKGKVDSYTRCALENGKKLHVEEIPFTYDLHNACLSKDCPAERSAKLTKRLNSTRGTASTQSSSTRQALQALGVLSIFKTPDGKNAFNIAWEHPIVQAIA